MCGRSTHAPGYRLVPFLVGALLVAGTLQADYLGSFEAGLRALDFHDWRQMAAAMSQAIAEQPPVTVESVRFYGMRRVPYIPHYFLGLGLFRQGDYAGAAAALAEAAAQGRVHGIFRARMEFFQEVCALRLGKPWPPPSPARPPLARSSPKPPPPSHSPAGASPQPPDPVLILEPGQQRRKALEESVQEGRQWISRGKTLMHSLAERRRRNPRDFDRDPARADVIAVAERRLQSASFQLEGCWREGDLEGAENARDDAHATWEMLDELAKDLYK